MWRGSPLLTRSVAKMCRKSWAVKRASANDGYRSARWAHRRASISVTALCPNTERTEFTSRWKRKGIGGLCSFSPAS
jgi:hypothetical protein